MRRKLIAAASLLVLIGFYGWMGYLNGNQTGWYGLKKPAAAAVVAEVAPIVPGEPVDYGARRAAIAMAEYQKGVRETTPGCNCGTDVEKYTLGLRKQWCAMFASWVMKEAGTPLQKSAVDLPEPEWRKTKARSIATWLEKNGTWHDRQEVLDKNLQPQPGDVIVFYRGDFEGDLGHADIVVAIDPSKPGFAELVGGNLYDKVAYRKSYYFAEHYGFLGFGRPNDPTTAPSTSN